MISANSHPYSIIIGDINQDNQVDIAVVNFDAINVIIFFEYSIIQSESPTVYTTGIGSLPYRMAAGDFNNNTQLDLAVVNSAASSVGVFLGYENGSFRERITYSTGNYSLPYSLALYDLDNDYQLDIVVANSNTESWEILYGYGNGTFATIRIIFIQESSSPRWITIADFNNDNHLDIAFAVYGTNNIGIFLGYGNRTFGYLTKHISGDDARPISMDAGDANNDGRLDIVVANYGINTIVVLLGLENGAFTLFTIYSTGINSLPFMIILADLNKDNHLNIFITNSGSDNFTYSTGTHSIPLWISVADVSNDYSQDLAIANSNTNNVGILLGNSSAYFSSQTVYLTGSGSSPKSIATGDFNKDSWLDIAVANYGSNNIAILLGHPSENSAKQSVNIIDNDSQLSSTNVHAINQDDQLNSTTMNLSTL
ncbi:unnamed protein product [Rotaria magnacalcarata]|uniref:VCBS repeat-containing protein n=1 Tax=Rotaria magnacalcarata TaxID=392030 RepID=A0A816K0W7_9BILA|nr:unnamed protein product [Rotaria magnacalcarata]CAF1592213.1 unnamed protein product [Rotaria magnacalcarata]CAF1906165.1 unnamed protein product [Rotaria magnacalcarata]CAF4118150.1 unnamed protein product [Rotaria magnacalcarata]CAF4160327.1 unnamed protein product [Rotaria magnacalcarata]